MPPVSSKPGKLRIGIPLYPNFDSLDVLGPFQTFTMQSESMDTKLLAPTLKPVRSYEGVEITPHATFDATDSLDVLFVPGGVLLEKVLWAEGTDKNPLRTNPLLEFIRRAGAPGEGEPKLVTSVCTGALFLAACGLLEGYRATTHWNYHSILAMFPGVTVAEGYPRFVIDSNRVTGGGISSGLDESMVMVDLLLGAQAAKRGQLIMQYAPNPPYQNGDPKAADPSVLFEVTQDMHDGVATTARAFRSYIDEYGSEIAGKAGQ
jgi:transcriptional regulator GlxA family with amidase domain